ncbi:MULTISPECIES: hypothetical protein [unclassified Microbulbifer]|uniref:hypothetical protein n=1 Tax=unclassified Microbulbifer TaxID=2619833 RepID=UPI0027E51BBE|nr:MULTISPECIES: hypothetical protein [unclassified Microbulbifer]
MKPAILTLLIFLGLFAVFASASDAIHTEIRKSDRTWTVTYRTPVPTQQLAFKRNPDRSRADRWTSASAEYQIIHEHGTDLIRRVDGKSFSEVTFTLTSSYTALPKDYAPFSPFSDGGMLIHSGRFFACSGRCESGRNAWRISLIAPEQDSIIVDGTVARGSVEWLDSDNGRKVYVGPQLPDRDERFISIIDPELPEHFRGYLHRFLPLMMTEYAKFLNQPAGSPILFVSFDPAHQGSRGRQGGVLPNQIFMHWYGEDAGKGWDERSVLWFFAHELAHLFQGTSGQIEEREHAWIHEGAAEYMAGLAMKSLMPETTAWVDARFSGVEGPCLEGLKEHSLIEAAERNRHWLYYTCGLFIHDAIAREASQHGEAVSFFSIWSAFQKRVDSGEAASFDVFILSLRPYVSEQFIRNLQQLIASSGTDLEPYLKTLTAKRQSRSKT